MTMNLIKKALIPMVLICSIVGTACKQEVKEEENNKKEVTMKQDMVKQNKLLRHVVLFKFKDDAPAEEVEKLNQSFNALPKAIAEIQDFEWGINDSPENFHQDFTHCYMVTFKSESDRDSIYTPHPSHQAFVASLQPYLEKVFVVDYWTNPK
jgi:hypothetical protein